MVPLDVTEPWERVSLFLEDAAPQVVLASAAQQQGLLLGKIKGSEHGAVAVVADFSAMARAAWALVASPEGHEAAGNAAAAPATVIDCPRGDDVAHVWYTSGRQSTDCR